MVIEHPFPQVNQALMAARGQDWMVDFDSEEEADAFWIASRNEASLRQVVVDVEALLADFDNEAQRRQQFRSPYSFRNGEGFDAFLANIRDRAREALSARTT